MASVPVWEMWPQLGPLITGRLMGIFAFCCQYFYPYVHIKFDEYCVDHLVRSDAYVSIENYLDSGSVKSTRKAKMLRAVRFAKNFDILYGIDENEEVTDVFRGVKVWWSSKTSPIRAQPMFSSNPDRDERRYYKLTFPKSYLDDITQSYVPRVLKTGKAVALRKRERKLYLNNPSRDMQGSRASKWNHVAFEHPATFDSLALDPEMKKDLRKDLIKFTLRKEYYAKIGKAWKRGYLLYGPPGTGKSTTIAAMANFLKYDVYDLELTTVKENSELKRLMVDTSSKSIIVIEDIDCSLNLTNERKKKKKKEDKEKDPMLKMVDDEEEESDSKVTFSGLLNSMDGIWSACGEERIIVFTTNFVDKLDPTLIRKGRMDMHIELSYCRFEAFKVLAKNYLGIKLHHLFEKISHLLEETDMTPADVADYLMPKSDSEDVELFEKIHHLLEETDMNLADVAENLMRESDTGDVDFEKIRHLLEQNDITPADVAEKLKRKSDVKEPDVETCLQNLIKALEEKVRSKAEKEGKENE